MSTSARFLALDKMTRIPASALKKIGWRGVMDALRADGRVLVTNHAKPEAVILTAAEYDALMQRLERSEAQTAAALAALSDSFDQRLAALQARSAGKRLRATLNEPARLGGKLKAGTRY